jgi:hypothetical protein
VLVIAAFATLPIALPRDWSSPTEHSPIGWILALLAVGVGSRSSRVDHRAAHPALVLGRVRAVPPAIRTSLYTYGTSNAGGMVGCSAIRCSSSPRCAFADTACAVDGRATGCSPCS